MEVRESDIRFIVEQVIDRLMRGGLSLPSEREVVSVPQGEGLFRSVDEAVRAAKKAFEKFIEMPLDRRRNIIRAIRKVAIQEAENLARMAKEETGMGRIEDKVAKNRLAALRTPGVEDLSPEAFTDEHGLTLVERAPYGVIASIIPSTNPTSTVINNTISMVSAGNVVVFCPHPGAKQSSCYTVSLLHRAIVEA